MDEKIIALISQLSGDASTLVIWYMSLDIVKTLVREAGSVGCAWVITTTIYRCWKLTTDYYTDENHIRYERYNK